MGYDRGDSFPFEFEPNGIIFGLKSKGKLSPRSYPSQCERKWKHSFLSVNAPKHGSLLTLFFLSITNFIYSFQMLFFHINHSATFVCPQMLARF